MIPLIIPSYEPDSRLLDLLDKLDDEKYRMLSPIVIINDGSHADKYEQIFDQVKVRPNVEFLVHEVNKGKGAALKTAFAHIQKNHSDVIGVVTADSDGQHTPECIMKVANELIANPKSLVLGVRNFTGEDIPWKSRFGNNVTIKVFSYASGVHVSDTQTGLRGIPLSFFDTCLAIKYDRFEYEMQMLLDSAGECPVREVEIETIYDSVEEHQTHFRPIADSVKIYSVLIKKFAAYIFSSLSSCLIDLALFSLFCFLFKNADFGSLNNLASGAFYVTLATICARVISATYNYIINYKFVFKSNEKAGKAFGKYVILAVVQMALSAGIVTGVVALLGNKLEVLIKLIVDTLLFFLSYYIQQVLVFRKTTKK